MPIYEYKCPNGHLFDAFHGMTEAGPTVCTVCGEGPLQVVLHPVAVHYKGSGFYSTDYGRKSAARKDSGSGDSSSGSSGASPVAVRRRLRRLELQGESGGGESRRPPRPDRGAGSSCASGESCEVSTFTSRIVTYSLRNCGRFPGWVGARDGT